MAAIEGQDADAALEIDIDVNEPGLAGWRSFLEAYSRIMGTLQTEMLAERGLELAEYVALFHLYKSEGHSMRMSELAELAFRSRSGMTRVVDRLERGGFVVRRAVPGNQRSRLAILTPEGKLELERAFPVHHNRLMLNVTSRLTTKEWEILRELLDRLG